MALRIVLAAVTSALATLASPVHAEWRRAESANFIVYSQDSEGRLREYTRNLEIYDWLLRARMGLPTDGTVRRKLPIYLVRNISGLRQINPATGPLVAGTYYPVGEDIFAAAISGEEQDFLLHEYFHHFTFSLQGGAGAVLPPWLVEGLAEYYMTAEIEADSVKIGGYNEFRVQQLFAANWLPLETLLTKRFSDVRGMDRESYYPVAWLLTHWFMSDESRRGQLSRFLDSQRQGAEPIAAMQEATGMSLADLRTTLRRYRRLPMITYEADFPVSEITVTRLPRSADDLLLIGQRLKIGVAHERRDEVAPLVRRLAARHPDDPFAMLQLGHAELHFGDPAAGEAVLTRLLEKEPDNVEALQFLATRYIRLASEAPDRRAEHLRQARSYLARAYQRDENAYYALQLLAETRQGGPGYPNENDLVTWDRAYQLAPQLAGIRLGYGAAMMRAGEFDRAIALLGPLANAAHGGGAALAAKNLIDRARAGQPPLSDAELEAAAETADRPTEPDAPPEGAPSEAPPSEEPEDGAGAPPQGTAS